MSEMLAWLAHNRRGMKIIPPSGPKKPKAPVDPEAPDAGAARRIKAMLWWAPLFILADLALWAYEVGSHIGECAQTGPCEPLDERIHFYFAVGFSAISLALLATAARLPRRMRYRRARGWALGGLFCGLLLTALILYGIGPA